MPETEVGKGSRNCGRARNNDTWEGRQAKAWGPWAGPNEKQKNLGSSLEFLGGKRGGGRNTHREDLESGNILGRRRAMGEPRKRLARKQKSKSG